MADDGNSKDGSLRGSEWLKMVNEEVRRRN